MKQQISNIIKVAISPAFLILLVISVSLWFISRLSNTYTSTIELGVELRNDYAATMWVEPTPLTVKVMVQGDGRDLILYKLGIGKSVTIPFSSLTVTQDPGASQYMCRIDEKSLLRALAAEQSLFTALMIMDTIKQVKVSAIAEAKLPVEPSFQLDFASQYTLSGDIALFPDTVMVKAPLSAIDTLKAIYTNDLEFNNLSSSANGTIGLKSLSDVNISTSMVRYNINVVGYTEMSFNRSIASPENIITVPRRAEVVVKIPFSLAVETLDDIKVALSDNYVDRDSTVKEVKVLNLPKSVIGWRVDPQFVECYEVKGSSDN